MVLFRAGRHHCIKLETVLELKTELRMVLELCDGSLLDSVASKSHFDETHASTRRAARNRERARRGTPPL